MKDNLYPSIGRKDRPTVMIDGIELTIPNDQNLKGKTLEVYQFFIQNEGDHGIREIQEVLGYSSPSVSQYHVKRLLEHDILVKTEDNRYRLKKDWMQMGSLEDHIRFLQFWIPRSLLYALSIIILLITSIVFVFLKITNYKIWGALFIPVLSILSFLLIWDTIKLSNKISK